MLDADDHADDDDDEEEDHDESIEISGFKRSSS